MSFLVRSNLTVKSKRYVTKEVARTREPSLFHEICNMFDSKTKVLIMSLPIKDGFQENNIKNLV